jgi:hypothetical protein
MSPFSHLHSSELGCCVGERWQESKSIPVRGKPRWQEICWKHNSKARRVRVDKTSHDPWDDDLATSSVPRNLGQPNPSASSLRNPAQGLIPTPGDRSRFNSTRYTVRFFAIAGSFLTPLQFPVGSAQRLRNPSYRYDDNLPCPLHHDFLLSACRQ